MGTNVNLTPELERFAQACVESGRFNNVSEVVRSALRMLQEAEERRAAFVASLEAAREEGLREGLATVEEVEQNQQLAAGRTNPEIGRALGLSTKAARNRVAHVLAKLGVADRTQAAVLAVELGLATPSS